VEFKKTEQLLATG